MRGRVPEELVFFHGLLDMITVNSAFNVVLELNRMHIHLDMIKAGISMELMANHDTVYRKVDLLRVESCRLLLRILELWYADEEPDELKSRSLSQEILLSGIEEGVEGLYAFYSGLGCRKLNED